MDKSRFFIVFIVISPIITNSQYTDDSDYDDFNIYEDRENKIIDSPGPDDFYIIPEDEKPKMEEAVRERKGLIVQEKMYRYTKHRIPGYDYDELDFADEINSQRCNERSIWTHCLCQFTCDSKNTIDCYTPCKSGCECKEDFVFDEQSQMCVYPDQCVQLIEI